MYSPIVMEHFTNPRNVGDIPDADGVGEVGNPVCGDMMTFSIKVDGDRLADVKFRTFGCGAAIAVSSMVSEMAIGKTLDEALELSNADVADALGGLPRHKLHCSNLGADALHKAIEDYKSGGALRGKPGEACDDESDHGHPVGDDDACRCPYCDHELPEGDALCRPCSAVPAKCPSCGHALPANESACATCNESHAPAGGG